MVVGEIRLHNNEKGQALVEFALIIIPLLFLILGTIEFGRVFHASHVITGAAREGARIAVVKKSLDTADAAIETKIEGAVASMVDSTANVSFVNNTDFDNTDPDENHIIYTVDPYSYTARTGDISVSVKVKGAVRLVAPLVSGLLESKPKTDLKIITAEAQMRLE
jgi:Flp pilus assembly protein TadG